MRTAASTDEEVLDKAYAAWSFSADVDEGPAHDYDNFGAYALDELDNARRDRNARGGLVGSAARPPKPSVSRVRHPDSPLCDVCRTHVDVLNTRLIRSTPKMTLPDFVCVPCYRRVLAGSKR